MFTEEQKAEVRRLADGRHSANEIAAAIGRVSRNAVIGWLHRANAKGEKLRLSATSNPNSGRPPEVRKPREIRQPSAPRYIAATKPKYRPIPPEPAPIAPENKLGPATLAELNYWRCKWPIWQSGTSPVYGRKDFCGEATAIPGVTPYCEFHRRKGYAPRDR